MAFMNRFRVGQKYKYTGEKNHKEGFYNWPTYTCLALSRMSESDLYNTTVYAWLRYDDEEVGGFVTSCYPSDFKEI